MLPDYNYMIFLFMSSLSNINEASQKDSLLVEKAILKVNMHLKFYVCPFQSVQSSTVLYKHLKVWVLILECSVNLMISN